MQKPLNTHGFTLIELVIVIVILGILAATAAPRFLDVTDDANKAVTKAEFSAFNSAVTLMHGTWLVKNTSPIVIDGQSIKFTSDGFPQGSTGNSAGCVELWSKLLSSSASVNPVGDPNAILNKGWNTFGYTDASNALCGYGKARHAGDTFLDGPYFIYFMKDTNIGGFSGAAGTLSIYNID